MQQIPDRNELLRLAQTPAGQKLLAMLQNSDSSRLGDAVSSAAAGNYGKTQEILSALLSSPEAQALLKELSHE